MWHLHFTGEQVMSSQVGSDSTRGPQLPLLCNLFFLVSFSSNTEYDLSMLFCWIRIAAERARCSTLFSTLDDAGK